MYRLFREELVQTYVLLSFSPIDIERVVLRPCLLAGLSVREWYRCFFHRADSRVTNKQKEW